jgi:hypothetical protein
VKENETAVRAGKFEEALVKVEAQGTWFRENHDPGNASRWEGLPEGLGHAKATRPVLAAAHRDSPDGKWIRVVRRGWTLRGGSPDRDLSPQTVKGKGGLPNIGGDASGDRSILMRKDMIRRRHPARIRL